MRLSPDEFAMSMANIKQMIRDCQRTANRKQCVVSVEVLAFLMEREDSLNAVLPKLWGLANLMRAKPTSVVEQEMASRLEQILNEAFDGSAPGGAFDREGKTREAFDAVMERLAVDQDLDPRGTVRVEQVVELIRMLRDQPEDVIEFTDQQRSAQAAGFLTAKPTAEDDASLSRFAVMDLEGDE